MICALDFSLLKHWENSLLYRLEGDGALTESKGSHRFLSKTTIEIYVD